MTLQEIKDKVSDNIGNDVVIKCNLGRNKFEKYRAKIKETYKNVFIVEVRDKRCEIKSCTYTDVMTKTIKIDY